MATPIITDGSTDRVQDAPRVVLPDNPQLFEERAARFERLAAGHPMGAYLGLMAKITRAQRSAFDARGARLGMGAGFYDRHFSFLLRRGAWRRPRLVGLAYGFQQVSRLPQEPWDVPLWGVVSDAGVHGHARTLLADRTTE